MSERAAAVRATSNISQQLLFACMASAAGHFLTPGWSPVSTIVTSGAAALRHTRSVLAVPEVLWVCQAQKWPPPVAPCGTV